MSVSLWLILQDDVLLCRGEVKNFGIAASAQNTIFFWVSLQE